MTVFITPGSPSYKRLKQDMSAPGLKAHGKLTTKNPTL